ncbi:VOC family protein [Aeromonas veronii]|uniref:VOC family protein n=1 Tax=Aeromonas veronii TaxID=654 RepID=UPI003D1A9417
MVSMSHPLDSTLGPMAPFVSQLLAELAATGVTISRPMVDHLCYRAATLQEYRELYAVLAEEGTLLVEGMIGGRPIATYQLRQPLLAGEVQVPCIELAAPKPGRVHQAGLEHIELVVTSLQDLVARYPELPFKTGNMQDTRNPDIGLMLPSGQIKFHLRPLAEVIAEEVATDAVVTVPADYFDQE